MSLKEAVIYPLIDIDPILRNGLITKAAQERLLSWSLVPDQLAELESYVLRYQGRYKRCPEKVAQFKTIYVENGLFGRQTAVVPVFFDFMGRKTGGQCLDLTNLLYFDLNAFEFTDRLYSSPQTANIRVLTVKGSSRYHFSNFHSTHIWVGITQLANPYVTHVEEDKMVVIDPSYQVIDTLEDSGYGVRTTWSGYPNNRMETDLSARVPVHNFKNMLRPQAKIDLRTVATVLGISADENFAFGLGFGKFQKTVFPFIEVWHRNSTDRSIYFINPSTGLIEHRDTDKQVMKISDSALAEIRAMLFTGKTFTYINQLIKKQ